MIIIIFISYKNNIYNYKNNNKNNNNDKNNNKNNIDKIKIKKRIIILSLI